MSWELYCFQQSHLQHTNYLNGQNITSLSLVTVMIHPMRALQFHRVRHPLHH